MSTRRIIRSFRLSALIFAGLMAGGLSHAVEPPEYDLADLGECFTSVMNNRGQIAGSIVGQNSVERPFIFNRSRAFLPDVPANLLPGTRIDDINDRGVAVGIGHYTIYLTEDLATTAFICRRGEIRSLSNVLPYPFIFNISINNAGLMAGTAQWTKNGDSFGFVYRHGARIVLPRLLPNRAVWVAGINNAGVVVGNSEYPVPTTMPDAGVASHAVMFVGGKVRDLGTLPYGLASSAVAINDRAEVVGWGDTMNGSYTRAFLYKNGRMHNLGTLPNEDESYASAINNHGVVVGSAGWRAALFHRGAVYDLNQLIHEPTTVTLVSATAINDRGQILAVGESGNSWRSFLLIPRRDQR